MNLETIAILGAVIGATFAIVATMLSLFLWVRSEANADRNKFGEIQREDRKDILGLIRSIELEMRDFHAQLAKQDAEFKAFMKERG
jgi:hypothetical protein